MSSDSHTREAQAIREAAARWTVRRDRGLSAREAIEFELWLAADRRHAEAMQRSAQTWAALDRIPEAAAQRELGAATRRRVTRRWFAGVAAMAAVVAIACVAWWWSGADPSGGPSLIAVGPRVVTLADGTSVRLNVGSELVEAFTSAERRVQLNRGEAYFSVTKNPARPFVVAAGNLEVRAVGTAFNVSLQPSQVEVLVTEGRVQVAADPGEPMPLVSAGQRAVVPSGPSGHDASPGAAVVTNLSADEMQHALAWHDSLLRLGGATLAEIAGQFERRTGQHVIFADPALGQLRMGGRFRADDVEGFANLLSTTFDIEVERAADGSLVLRKKSVSQ